MPPRRPAPAGTRVAPRQGVSADSARPLTVAMLIQRYYPHLGGAEQQLRALAPRLLVRGVRPLILTRRLPGTPSWELLDGVAVHRFPAGGPKLLAASQYAAAALAFLWRERRRVDVLHAHELLSPATVGLAGAWAIRRPLVVKVLRGGVLSDLRALRRRPLGELRWRLYRRWVDRFISLSSEIDRELAGEGVPAERIARIPNGVDAERFGPPEPAERTALRRRLGLDDAPTAIFVGRLAPEKRVGVLARAWPAVRRAVPGAQLLVVGEGPERRELERLPAAGLWLLGRREPVVPYLQASDVFVLPSLAEGLSNAMLEAMACGLCCVVHPHGGARDVLRDRESGRLLPDASAEALGRVLAEALANKEARRRMGERARHVVVQGYSLEATADRLVALYRELAERTPCAASPA